MPKLIRDIADTSGYWAAAWTMCMFPDVHVICDAPIGCYNLVAVAVSDYTDAIPRLDNITPSVIREEEVGGSGTGPAVQRTFQDLRATGKLDGKQVIVVSTAESEMIGSDLSSQLTEIAPGSAFYYSNSLAEDEWAGRDRALVWLWENFGRDAAAGMAVEPGTVNIIGPTYGCFNSPADLHEVRRLVEGAGGRINLVIPAETALADLPKLARAQVNVVLHKEYGHSLAAALGQPWLHAPMGMYATTEFIEELGRLLGTADTAAAFIQHKKATTLQAVRDLWNGPQGDWFPTTTVGIAATRTYTDGLTAFLGDELGMPIAFAAPRPAGPDEMDNDAVRNELHHNAPTFVFGSINEKIYLSEAGARYTSFIPAAFPGPIVRRSVGTPFMGYRGAVYVVQETVNRLYEALFQFLPVDAAYAQMRNGGPTPAQTEQPGNLPWQPAAQARLERALAAMPFLPRISASREVQMQAESLARTRKLTEVTPDLVDEILASARK